MTQLNVEDYGMVPWTTDPDAGVANSAALQTLVDRLGVDLFGTISFPSRAYAIATTIDIPKVKGGIAFNGSGSINYLNAAGNNNYMSCQSRLVWTGFAGGTMVQCSSSGLAWDGVALCGHHTESSPDRAGVGFKQLHESGIGGGHACFNNTTFGNCDIGYDTGDTISTDTVSFTGNTIFDLCNSGFRSHNSQSVGYTFNHVFCRHCDIVFDVELGGRLTVTFVTALNTVGTLLKEGVGSNGTDLERFMGVQVDAAASDIVLYDGDAAQYGSVVFECVLWGPKDPPANPLFKLYGMKLLTLRNFEHIQPGMVSTRWISTTPRTPTVIMDGCRMRGETVEVNPELVVNAAASNGVFNVRWTNCSKRYGEMIPNDSFRST